PGCFPGVLGDLVALPGALWSGATGDIAVGIARGTLDGTRRISANQQLGTTWPHRLGSNRSESFDGRLASPDAFHGSELFVKALATLVEGHASRLEIVFARTNAKSQGQTAIGERIEARRLFCQDGGVAQRRQQHRRHQPNALRRAG